jgi:hypothetical protein
MRFELKIETYTIAFNNPIRIQWYLDHYNFADKHFIFDDSFWPGNRTVQVNDKK